MPTIMMFAAAYDRPPQRNWFVSCLDVLDKGRDGLFAGNSHRTARHARQSHHAAAQAAPWGDSGAVRAFHVARAAAAAAAAAAALLLLLLLPLLGGSVHGHETFQGAPLFFWSLPPPPPLHSSASLPPPASPLSSSFPPSPVLSGASRRVRAEASCAPPTNVRFPCYDVI